MGFPNALTVRLAAMLVLNAASVGLAAPSVLVTRPMEVNRVEWLLRDNQSYYTIGEGEVRKLELNTTLLNNTPVYITVSPCRDVQWAIYKGNAGCSDGHLDLVKEYIGVDVNTFQTTLANNDRYVLRLSSENGGAAAVSVSGEKSRPTRLRLRVKSRRRLSANWDPSPIDPQATTYCVVASQRRNYTSLCAAQYDLKSSRSETKPTLCKTGLDPFDRQNNRSEINSLRPGITNEEDNKIDADDNFDSLDFTYKSYRRRKFGRSTRVTGEDPLIACIGERTHHLIENLDPSTTYYVSVFGLGRDRRVGTLLATGSVRPRTSTAKRLREKSMYKTDVKGKAVFYYKATVSPGDGMWLAVSTCGGAVDVEVLVRGKRLYYRRNIEPQEYLFVPAPMFTSSVQETSNEGSIQFDSSSSEEARLRYVIKINPSMEIRNGAVALELIASTTRWGLNMPELAPDDGAVVRELRPRRSCRSVDVAFLPATHHATDVIRYCIAAREIINGENYNNCRASKRSYGRSQCINNSQKTSSKVIVHKVHGLKPGRKYAIQVTASTSKVNTVSYKDLYVDTNLSCKGELL